MFLSFTNSTLYEASYYSCCVWVAWRMKRCQRFSKYLRRAQAVARCECLPSLREVFSVEGAVATHSVWICSFQSFPSVWQWRQMLNMLGRDDHILCPWWNWRVRQRRTLTVVSWWSHRQWCTGEKNQPRAYPQGCVGCNWLVSPVLENVYNTHTHREGRYIHRLEWLAGKSFMHFFFRRSCCVCVWMACG